MTDNFYMTDERVSAVTIDAERLRKDMKDYYGTAAYSGFPMAVIDLSKVETCSDEELIRLAQRERIDLNRYILL